MGSFLFVGYMFGVDWDGDGEETLLDDAITMDVLDEDDEDYDLGDGKRTGSCLAYIITVGIGGMIPIALIILHNIGGRV